VVVAGVLLLVGDLVLVAISAAAGSGPASPQLPVLGQVDNLVRLPYLPPPLVAALAAVLAVGLLMVAVGFWRRRRWAWVWVMVLAAVLLTVNLVATVQGAADHLTMAIAIVLVLYANQREVQQRFGTQPERPAWPVLPTDDGTGRPWEAGR
jgi:lysylphosphatidylglycerol synthetase-like protein (DUF2156 family)